MSSVLNATIERRHVKMLSLHSVCLCLMQQFCHVVENVRPLKGSDDSNSTQWRVDVRELKTDSVTSHVFDAVMVCNGYGNNLFETVGR